MYPLKKEIYELELESEHKPLLRELIKNTRQEDPIYLDIVREGVKRISQQADEDGLVSAKYANKMLVEITMSLRYLLNVNDDCCIMENEVYGPES